MTEKFAKLFLQINNSYCIYWE